MDMNRVKEYILKEKIVHYTDIMKLLNIAPTTARERLKKLCEELKCRYIRGYCICVPA